MLENVPINSIFANNLRLDKGIYVIPNGPDSSLHGSEIGRILSRSGDLSSDSRELEAEIFDAFSKAQLSRSRALSYRSLNFFPEASVLEIGSGSGPISRYLGERAKFVTAVERNADLARDCAIRTGELGNVVVVNVDAQKLLPKKKFDIVVVNIVFDDLGNSESSLNLDSGELDHYLRFLAVDGSLILTFSRPFGRTQTSSTEFLASLRLKLRAAYRRSLGDGRAQSDVLIPLPDHRYPSAIIRLDLLQCVDCAELFSSISGRWPDGSNCGGVDRTQAWRGAQAEAGLQEFANSYQLIVGPPGTLVSKNWLGDIYSIRRRREYAIRTRIFGNSEGKVRTLKSPYINTSGKVSREAFEHRMSSTEWVNGESIQALVSQILRSDVGRTMSKQLQSPVKLWWSIVGDKVALEAKIDGRYVDYNWQNAIVCKEGIKFIDDEWRWRTPISPVWLVYRTVQKFVNDEYRSVDTWGRAGWTLSVFSFVLMVLRIIEVPFDFRTLLQSVKEECLFQDAVTGQKNSTLKVFASLFEPIRMRRFRHASQMRRIASEN